MNSVVKFGIVIFKSKTISKVSAEKSHLIQLAVVEPNYPRLCSSSFIERKQIDAENFARYQKKGHCVCQNLRSALFERISVS